MSTSISTELGLLTTKSLTSKELGKQFFSMLLEKAPEVSPQKYDHGEPVSIPFEPEHMDGALDLWRDAKLNRCFLWTRARPRVIGSYWPAHRLHPVDSVRISVEGKRIEVEQLTSLLQACAAAYEPVIGYVHRTYSGDLVDLEFYESRVMPFGRGLNLHDLKRGLPSLPWACVLGSEYVELLGRERILSTPLYSVAEIPGGLWLQLSERIDDGERDYESYSALRRSAIDQLDHGVFLRGLSDLTRLPKVVERLQTGNR